MTTRTFSPCWNALTVCTGVAKSITSSRRRRFSGSEVLRNSMTMFCPCWRISMPVVVSVRSIMMRPSPALPRRKSTSRMACLPSALPSAKCATWPAAPAGATAAALSVTTMFLPSSETSCATDRRRLSTMRVRSEPCTRFMLRNSPCATSCAFRPSPLDVFAKSNTMRAGLATVKLGGTAFSGSLVAIRMTTLPPCWATSKASMLLLAWASASPIPSSHRASSAPSSLKRPCVVISCPPAFAPWCCARPSLRRCPGPLPSG
jgi:hypothetical protein